LHAREFGICLNGKKENGDSPKTVADASSRAAILGPERVPITLSVNGAAYKILVEPRTTLAEALRFELDKTGTKVVCDRGSCSACTVWVDNVTVCSCMTFALDVGDTEETARASLCLAEPVNQFRDSRQMMIVVLGDKKGEVQHSHLRVESHVNSTPLDKLFVKLFKTAYELLAL